MGNNDKDCNKTLYQGVSESPPLLIQWEQFAWHRHTLAAKESGLEHAMCEPWWLHCTSQWGRYTPLSEHVYCVAITFKMTEGAEQQICIKFCIKLKHSSTETIWMMQKATAMGNWWSAASSWQCTRSCITSHAEFFGKTSNHSGDSAPLQPRCGTLWLLAFPKTKSTFEREEILDHGWDSGIYNEAAYGNWENCVRSQGAYFEGDWGVIVYVQCSLYLSQ